MPQASNTGRFQYTGQMWYGELGMYNYKARLYAPTLGRFMQTDPIGYGDGLNWYNYVVGDPVNFVDPSGLSCNNGGPYCDPAHPGVDAPGDPDITITGSREWHWYESPIQAVTLIFNVDWNTGLGDNLGGAGQQSGNKGCGTHSDLADAALYVLNFAGTTADAASLGLAAASAATGGPLDPVGASLGFGALVANRISAATSGAAIPINLYQGNYRGAAANVAGLVAGHFAADLAGKA